MKHVAQENQCPNCWGYQQYDEKQPDNILCNCPKN